jgi:hypothetical protein
VKHPRAFLLIVSAALTIGCASGAYSLRPIGEHRGSVAGFAWFAAMAAAGSALTLAAGADLIGSRD